MELRLRDLRPGEIADYHRLGYVVLRGFLADTDFIETVRREIRQVGRVLTRDFELNSAASYISALRNEDRTALYRSLRYLRSLARLSGSDELARISHQLGMATIAIHSCNIRMDMPQEGNHLLPWHQDIPYILGSFNSLTYWIPLGTVNARNGSVEVLAHSHRSGIAPVRFLGGGDIPARKLGASHLALVDEPEQKSGTVIEAQANDIVVFSQFIMHRSVPNHSDAVRWTIQIRHSDLGEAKFAQAGYPFGEETTLFHNRYLFEGRE
jgi:ectoine hydroxylase-related dioxygenase (phytanoyl-CoA dioxygenase family)